MHVPSPSSLALANQCLGPADTVICLHSSTGSQAQWKPLVQALTPRWQVLALDLYGHGRSPVWPAEAPNTLDVDADAVQQLLQGLDEGADDAATAGEASPGVHLVGHSYGAAVALRVAMRRPRLVRSLTLYEPVVFGLLQADEGADAARHEIEDIARSVAGLVKANALVEAARVFVGYWGGPQAWLQMNPTQQATVIHRISTVPRHFEALFAARWRTRQFARLQMPVLLMQGSETRRSAAAVVQQLLQALPQARHCMVEGAAHLGPITHSAAVRQVMQQHLDSGTAPARVVPGCIIPPAGAIPPAVALRPQQQLADSRLQQLAQPVNAISAVNAADADAAAAAVPAAA